MGLLCGVQGKRIALLLSTLPWPLGAFLPDHPLPQRRGGSLLLPARGLRLGPQSRSRGLQATIRHGTSLDTLHTPLSSQQLLHFEREGHTLVRGLLSKQEMDHWKPALLKAFQEEELEAYRHEVRVFFGDEAYKKATTMEECHAVLAEKDEDTNTPFLQVFNFWRRHENLRAFSLAKRFGNIAAQLLGVERVRLYQDSLFIKRPGDGPTLFHTDLGTAPLDTNDMLTIWMPLVEVPSAAKGGSPLSFATGSHRDMSVGYWWNPHHDDDDLLDSRYSLVDYSPLLPGDATIHHGWCLHASPPNELSEPRLAITLALIADGARTIPDTAEYEPDAEDSCSYDDWISDIAPGDVVDHPLVPIVWP